MTKITKLEEKTFEGKHSGYSVSFDDNRSGNLQEKQSDKELRVGDTVIVTEIPYTSKAGKTSTLYGVRLSQATQSAPQPSVQEQQPLKPQQSLVGKTKEEQKVNAAISAMEFVISAIVNGETDWPKMPELQRHATQLLWDEIDEIYNGKA